MGVDRIGFASVAGGEYPHLRRQLGRDVKPLRESRNLIRTRAIALVRVGKPADQTAVELGIHPVTLSKWLRQDDIDHGLRPGKPSAESAESRAARRRLGELETELAIIRHAAKFLGQDTAGPQGGSTR